MTGPGIALYKPMIPPNTGNIARLSVALNAELFIVGQTPIKWDQPSLKRAGLDHWDKVRFEHIEGFREFLGRVGSRRIIAVTKESATSYWDFQCEQGDIFLFGNETRGLPPKLLRYLEHSIKIPMWGEGVRSLNLANSAAIVAYEYCRQMAARGIIDKNGYHYERTYYRRAL